MRYPSPPVLEIGLAPVQMRMLPDRAVDDAALLGLVQMRGVVLVTRAPVLLLAGEVALRRRSDPVHQHMLLHQIKEAI